MLKVKEWEKLPDKGQHKREGATILISSKIRKNCYQTFYNDNRPNCPKRCKNYKQICPITRKSKNTSSKTDRIERKSKHFNHNMWRFHYLTCNNEQNKAKYQQISIKYEQHYKHLGLEYISRIHHPPNNSFKRIKIKQVP